MKTKKRFVKIFFSLLIVFFIVSTFSTFIYFLLTNNKNEVKATPEVTNPNNKPEPKKDFASNNLEISFNIDQNIYILKYHDGAVSFEMDNFKYFFLQKFNKLGPKSQNINLKFSIDDKKNIKNVNVFYTAGETLYS